MTGVHAKPDASLVDRARNNALSSLLAAHTGMHLARNKLDPDYRQRGACGGPRMVAFTSEHAHYSYTKAAFLTGASAPIHART